MSKQTIPDTVDQPFEQETYPPGTPVHGGPIASGGQGYDENMTRDLDAHRLAQTPPQAPVKPQPAKLGGGFWVGLIVFLLVLAGVVVYGILARSHADTNLSGETKAESIPEVSVTHATSTGASGDLALPGNTQPYVDTPIYSRTNGYLQKWFFDIGARVKKGQLMATIETPELDQQLQVAQADLKASQANLDLANITSNRYQNLLKSNSVSKQETDQAMGDAAAKQAAVEASMAAVRRLEQLQSFEKIYAPFDGVVTRRETDIGDLITAGTGGGGGGGNGGGKELFRLASIGELRVFVAVPEAYSNVVRNGGTATLTLDEFPGQVFTGVIARNANAIDSATRTLNVEVDVANPTGKLLPGAYAIVHFKVPAAASNLTIPSNTLLFRAQGMQVGVVTNGRVRLVPVKISQDHGAFVEISSGLSPQDAIVLDPSDSLQSGAQVRVVKDVGAAK
jgi:RND family efflux transporter MFP subunit